MNLYVGTSGYSYPEWKGSFYPQKLPAKQMLQFYGEHFRAVESNYTFRRLPTESALQAWADAVPDGFRFALKAPQQITHIKRLKDVAEPVARFLEVAKGLKRRLGPLLFQLPPNFKKDAARLRDLLALVPRRRAALEFRHPSWFDEEVFGLLHKRGGRTLYRGHGRRPRRPIRGSRRLGLPAPARDRLQHQGVEGLAPADSESGLAGGVRVLQA